MPLSTFSSSALSPGYQYSMWQVSHAGSRMSRISSFTETTGFRSPHSLAGAIGAGASGARAFGAEEPGDEHDAVAMRRTKSPALPAKTLRDMGAETIIAEVDGDAAPWRIRFTLTRSSRAAPRPRG